MAARTKNFKPNPVRPKQTELIFGNGARSLILLGLVPLKSLNRSFLWMTELSNSQNVAVPVRTRTNRRMKRSHLRLAPEETCLKIGPGSQAEQKGLKTRTRSFLDKQREPDPLPCWSSGVGTGIKPLRAGPRSAPLRESGRRPVSFGERAILVPEGRSAQKPRGFRKKR